MPNTILGIDPGSRNMGIAVLTRKNSEFVALRCDTLTLAHLDDHSERLQKIFEEITLLVQSVQPEICAIETPVYGVDPLAMHKLGRAQAAAMLAMTNNGFGVIEYYPKTVKKAITGNGNADKKQVAYMLEKMITLPDEKLSDDATDALAVAWCHHSKQNSVGGSSQKKHQNRSSGSWSDFVKNNPDRVNE